MAINKVPFPASVPAAVGDYQKQNALIAALVGQVDGAQKVVGSNVVKGAVFNVGGTLYLAAADTAISGVASDYVKLTPSGDTLTLAPSFVSSLSGVAWNSEYKGYYDGSGNLYEFDEMKAFSLSAMTRLYKTAIHGRKAFLGNGTFIVPAGVSTLFVSGCAAGGAGGAGGGASSSTLGGGGGGGGGAGESVGKIALAASPGDSLGIVVGSGNSTVGALLTLHAGGAGGAGGAGSAGAIGGAGSAGACGGGAGAAAGAGLYGGVPGARGGGAASYPGFGGGGGAISLSSALVSAAGGNGGNEGANGSNGVAGTTFGGGGSGGGGAGGGGSGSHSGGAGGAGGAGIIIIEW